MNRFLCSALLAWGIACIAACDKPNVPNELGFNNQISPEAIPEQLTPAQLQVNEIWRKLTDICKHRSMAIILKEGDGFCADLIINWTVSEWVLNDSLDNPKNIPLLIEAMIGRCVDDKLTPNESEFCK